MTSRSTGRRPDVVVLAGDTVVVLEFKTTGSLHVADLDQVRAYARDLADYHLAHAARADLSRRLGQAAQARISYEKALALARQEPERAFLAARLRDLPP